MMARPRYNPGGPAVRLDNTGRVFVPTPSGERQYLQTAPPTDAVHSNPGFEAETAGYPDYWDFFWGTGDTTISSETDLVYSGERSLKVELAAGGGDRVVMSTAFDALGRGFVEFSVFACKTEGSPTIQCGSIIAESGTPTFFDGVSAYYETPAMSLGAEWERYDYRVSVPRGHERARIFFRVAASASEAVTAFLDLTTSQVFAPTAPIESQAGSVTVSLSSASEGYRVVTFAEPFDEPPAVQVTTRDTSYLGVCSNVTEESCRVHVAHRNGTALTTSVPADWTATPKTQ